MVCRRYTWLRHHKVGPEQNEKDSADLYTSQGWKGSSTVTVPVMPEP
jgi:hypothetical protein